MPTLIILHAVVKLYTPCSLAPWNISTSWLEVLEKKAHIYPSFLTASGLSYIPSHAFAGIYNLVVSDNFDGKVAELSHIGADSRLVPSQWETSLQSNAVSHWLAQTQDQPSIVAMHHKCPLSQLSLMQYMGICVVKLPISPLMVVYGCVYFNTLRPRQNSCHFTAGSF